MNWVFGPSPVSALAQGEPGGIGTAVLMILVLIAAVILLGVVLMRLRRAYLGPEEDPEGVALPLDELRRLRDTGELSEADFQRAVDVIAEAAKRDNHP